MQYLLFTTLAAISLTTSAFAQSPATACPVINGHFVDEAASNSFSLHTKQDGNVFSYAFGDGTITYFPATGEYIPTDTGRDAGKVKIECGAGYLLATEVSFADGTSTIRITPTGADTFHMDGTGIYSVGTGNYHAE